MRLLRSETCGLFFTLVCATTACGKHDSAPPSSGSASVETGKTQPKAASVADLSVRSIDGETVALRSYQGKVLLVVNTASKCGYTPQYEGLESIYKRYAARGFSVLGFPSNDFGGQEPGNATEIATFCKTRFGVSFPLFEKTKVRGPERSELFARLSSLGEPKWNFHKYLLNKNGEPVRAFGSSVEPTSSELTSAIEAELAR